MLVCAVSVRWRCRIYDAKPPGNNVVHAAVTVSNFEIAYTSCGSTRGVGDIYEAPRGLPVTCIRCIAMMLVRGDGWT